MSAQDEMKNTGVPKATNETIADPQPEVADAAPATTTTADATQPDETDEFVAYCKRLVSKITELRRQIDQYVSGFDVKENPMLVGEANSFMCAYALLRHLLTLALKPYFDDNALILKDWRDNGVVQDVLYFLDPANYHPAMAGDRNFRRGATRFNRARHLTSDYRDRDTGEVKSVGEINTPLNAASGLTLYKALCLQCHGLVGVNNERDEIQVPNGKTKDGKTKTKTEYVFTQKKLLRTPTQQVGAVAKSKGKGKGKKSRDKKRDQDDKRPSYGYTDERKVLYYEDAVDRLVRRARMLGADETDAMRHLMRCCAPFHNQHVSKEGPLGLVLETYKAAHALRRARAEAKRAERNSKSGSRQNGKGGRQNGKGGRQNGKATKATKSGKATKSYGVGRQNGKGGRPRNKNSRVTISGDSAPQSKPKRRTTFFEGRPCEIVKRRIKEEDAEGFIKEVMVSVRRFLDAEGGEMILAPKKQVQKIKATEAAEAAEASTSTSIADAETDESEAQPEPESEPESESEPAPAPAPAPTGPAPGSWAAMAATPPDPEKIAEAERRLQAKEVKAKRRHQNESRLLRIADEIELNKNDASALIRHYRGLDFPDISGYDDGDLMNWIKDSLGVGDEGETNGDDKSDGGSNTD